MNPGLVAAEVLSGAAERRRFPRHRYSAPMIIRRLNLPEIRGMSVEISESGASVITDAYLKLGDTVELEPVGASTAAAVVRRCWGRFHGFEFLNLSPEQAGRIRDICRMLPLYRSKTLDLWAK